jgi:hypothetical protein
VELEAGQLEAQLGVPQHELAVAAPERQQRAVAAEAAGGDAVGCHVMRSSCQRGATKGAQQQLSTATAKRLRAQIPKSRCIERPSWHVKSMPVRIASELDLTSLEFAPHQLLHKGCCERGARCTRKPALELSAVRWLKAAEQACGHQTPWLHGALHGAASALPPAGATYLNRCSGSRPASLAASYSN